MTSFSLSGGVEVVGFISPTDTNDTYPVIDPLYGIDGFRNVNTIKELNEIPNLRRRAGMVVGVSGGTTYYKLLPEPWNGTLSDWEIFQSGTFTGGTVSGDTIFLSGITATTISAATYLNLPPDTYVTGGTYSNGVTTFTNTTGGTFDVIGFYTGSTDVYVTGGTYSNGVATFINNTGGTFSVTGFVTGDTFVTGMTFNNSNYELKILRNDGVSLSSDLSILSSDVTITGGTYNSSTGTATFTNNTGGTFNVTGFLTGFTDIYVTGGTVSSLGDLNLYRNDNNAVTISKITYWTSGSTGTNSIKAINTSGLDSTGDRSVSWGNQTMASGNDSTSWGNQTSATTVGSTSSGYKTLSSGNYSTSSGYLTTASGSYSHSEGAQTTATNNYSHSEGYLTTTLSEGSHAEGYLTTSSGLYSHAEGQKTNTIGQSSHSEGYQTQSIGIGSHSEGYYTTSIGDYSHSEGDNTQSVGQSSHSEGQRTTSVGVASHSEGRMTTSIGNYSTASGYYTISVGLNSHSEGTNTISQGDYSHSEGRHTTSSGYASHSEGLNTTSSGNFSHSEGKYTTSSGIYSSASGYYVVSNGYASHAEGSYSTSSGYYSHAEGGGSTSIGNTSHAEGGTTKSIGNSSHSEGGGTISFGNYSHSEGSQTIALNDYSHSEGFLTTSIGYASHSEGHYTISIGNYSHSEGQSTTSSGYYSHAEGISTTSSGVYSHSEGSQTIAIGGGSHSEGSQTTASGGYSHSEGYQTTASGYYSHAEGKGTISSGNYSHAQGSGTTSTGVASFSSGINSVALTDGTFIHSENSVVSGRRSIVLGGKNITGSTDDTVYVPHLNLNYVPTLNNSNTQILSRNSSTGQVEYTPLSAISKFDVFVTGGTYSNGTATFTNNTGGTFNVIGFPSSTGSTNYYGSFSDSTTQIVSGSNIPTVWRYNTTEISNGIYIQDGTKIKVSNTGIYEIGYSAQMRKTQGGTSDDVTIWAKINGNDVIRTSSTTTFANNGQYSLPFVSYIFELNAGDYVEFYFSSPSQYVEITTLSGLTSPIRPDAPSVIIVAKEIGNATVGTSGDTYVTGLTLNDSTLSLNQNRIGSYSGFNVNLPFLFTSGGTMTGAISGTTYYGDGSNLTGISRGGGGGAGGRLYYFNISNTQTPYYEFSTTATTSPEQTLSVSVPANTTSLVGGFMTPIGDPNVTSIPAGILSFYLHAYDGTTNHSFDTYVELYKRTTGGTETLLFTSDIAAVIGNTPQMVICDGYFSGTTLNITDRLVAKVYGVNITNQTRTIDFVSEGSTHYSFGLTTIPTFTDTYVTGFTYGNNNLTIQQNNNQSPLTVNISTMTGLTVNTMVISNPYVPSGSTDPSGVTGTISWSGNTLYFKNSTGWIRITGDTSW